MHDLQFQPPFFGTTGGGGGSGTLTTIKDHGSTASSTAVSLNFTGNVVVSGSGANITVSVRALLPPDVLANRPSAASAKYNQYFATDVGYFSYSDGTIWTALLIDLTNGVTGTLAIANGGTGATTVLGAHRNLPFTYTALSTNTTLAYATNEVVLVDTTGGNVTITLPTAVGNTGQSFTIKKAVAANTLTIDTTSSQTIDGSLTAPIYVANVSVTLVSDGANWRIV